MKNNILFKFIICMCLLGTFFSLNVIDVNAVSCTETDIKNFYDGKVTYEDFKSKNCSCNWAVYSVNQISCTNIYKNAEKKAEIDKNNEKAFEEVPLAKVYKYQLKQYETIDQNGKSTTTGKTIYANKMEALLNKVNDILNIVLGVIIFILAFGFLWNVTQMGVHSSNAQQREIFLSRLGDIFATALFIGLIPIIFKLLLSVMVNI